jgi:hypothetical protein
LSANVTSIRGQIQLFTESINEFEDSAVPLPSNLTIDGITTTLTAFPTPLDTSITYATANRFIYDDSSNDDSDTDHQGYINATTTPRSGDLRGRYPKGGSGALETTRRLIPTQNRILCAAAVIVKVTRRLIVSKAIDKLPEKLRKKILENYYHH